MKPHYYECHVNLGPGKGDTLWEEVSTLCNHCGFRLGDVNGNLVATARTKTKARAEILLRWLVREIDKVSGIGIHRAKIEAAVYDTKCGDLLP